MITEITYKTHGCGNQARVSNYFIDACMVPYLWFLHAMGYSTRACCCGHCKVRGSIILSSGTMLKTGVVVER